MKKWAGIVIAGIALVACVDREPESGFTGREAVYALQAASTFTVSGTVTFRERKDGKTLILVEVSGTSGPVTHPIHLHLGDLATADAEIAALLSPLTGSTGKSETTLQRLANEAVITYDQLVALNASIKIHLSDFGPERDVILAAGNIGSAVTGSSSGRLGIAVCKSE